jgi:hypothetical protein
MITAVFRNREFATTLFQVLRCIPIYLAAIPIPPETHILFYYIPFLFLVYTIVTFPSGGLQQHQVQQHQARAQTVNNFDVARLILLHVGSIASQTSVP